MRIAFAGTPEFARQSLAALHAAGFDIPLVLTQPDKPAGRGLHVQASPVKQYALEHGMAVLQPRGLKLDGRFAEDAADAHARLREAGIALLVVAAYGLILPASVLDLPPRGCLNVHASLLPRWRGAAPIHRAIEAGDTETGITIMQMDVGLDTGPMLLRKALPIAAQDTTGSLHDRLAVLGGEAIVQALGQLDGLRPEPQPAAGVTYAAKIDKQEAVLDWQLPAVALARKIRAFNPFPGASTQADGLVLKIWAAGLEEQAGGVGLPGTVLRSDAQGVAVATGDGVLAATQLQKPGGKRLPAADFLQGHPLPAGSVLGEGKRG
jgi:methionyl-tRNA formyltransferase